MAAKKEPTHFVVGTNNSNGQEATVYTDRFEAEQALKSLIEAGFEDNEIDWIEGFRRKIFSIKTINVKSFNLSD